MTTTVGIPAPPALLFPASYAQERMWFFHRMDPGNPFYNVPLVLHLQGTVDLERLRAAVADLVARHEILRTTYVEVDGELRQRVHDRLDVPVTETTLVAVPADTPPADVAAEPAVAHALHELVRRPFDLTAGAPMRVDLIRLGAGAASAATEAAHLLVLCLHHIAVDGWSLGVLVADLDVAYQARLHDSPPQWDELAIQYGDYAEWQRAQLGGGDGGDAVVTALAPWRERLAGPLPTLELATDRPHPPAPAFRGERVDFALAGEQAAALRRLARSRRASLFMTLLAGWAALLHRLTGQTDLVIGTLHANRDNPQVAGLVGLFVNTLPARLDLAGEPTFADLLAQVRATSLRLIADQDMPVEKIVDDLRPDRRAGRNPLFQVVFALQNFADHRLRLADLDVTRLDIDRGSARFDLELHVWDHPDALRATLIFDTELFDRPTAARIAEHLQTLLAAAAADPDGPIRDLPLFAPDRPAAISPAPVPGEAGGDGPSEPAGVPELVARWARRSPHAAAVAGADAAMTYRELDERSAALAGRFAALGAGPGATVAGILPADAVGDTVVTALAALRTGADYLPLEPSHPREWNLRRLAHAGARILAHAAPPGPDWPAWLDDPRAGAAVTVDVRSPAANTPPPASDAATSDEATSDAATSDADAAGTGTPGVGSVLVAGAGAGGAVRVGAGELAAEVADLRRRHPLRPRETVGLHAPADTDAALWTVWWALTSGACLRPAAAGETTDVALLPGDDGTAGDRWPAIGGAPARRLLLVYGRPADPAVLRQLAGGAPGARPEEVRYRYGTPLVGGGVVEGTLAAAGPDRDGVRAATAPVGFVGEVVRRPLLVVDGHGRSRPHTAVGALAVAATDPDRPLPTGDLGRITGDGRVQVLAAADRPELLWAGPYQVRAAVIEAAIVADPGIAHACVLPRRTTDGATQLVAYVVPAAAWLPATLPTRLRAVLPAALVPTAVVTVTILPLTASGQVDTAALLRLPVLDDRTAAAWRARLAALPAVGEVDVRVEDAPPDAPVRRHLDEFDEPPDDAGRSATPAPGFGPEPAAVADAASAPGVDAPTSTGADGPVRGDDRPPAVLDGGPQPDPGLPDLGAAIRWAAASAGWLVHVTAEGHHSRHPYAEVASEADRILAGLRARGARPGDPIVFQCDRTADFVPLLWACLLGGLVSVPLAPVLGPDTPGDPVSRLDSARRLLADPLVVASPTLTATITDTLAGAGLPPARIVDLDALRAEPVPAGGGTHDQPPPPWSGGRDTPAMMLFTSGSSGTPKAVVLSHGNILARCVSTGRRNLFGPDTVSVNWMPLEHVGGVVMFHLRDVCLGGSQVLAATSWVLADPPRWLELTSRYRATATWAPNFAFGLVNDRADELDGRGLDLSRLRFILNAGEAIVPRTARAFLRVLAGFGLPADAMHPAWGMSETSSAVLYSDRFRATPTRDDDAFVEVGTPLEGCAVRIVDAVTPAPGGRVLREGETGRLQVRGASVTDGYHGRPDLAEASFSADGWFDTGDLAVIRAGQVTVTGRAKDVIVVNGANHHCHEIEGLVERTAAVETSFTAACAVRGPRDHSERLAVFVHLRPGADETATLREIRAAVRDGTGINPDYLIPVDRADIPKSDIGKIQRSTLVRRFTAGDFTPTVRRVELALGGRRTVPDWFHRPVWPPRTLDSPPAAAAGATAAGAPTADREPVLVLADRGGLGDALARRLRTLGRPCVLVIPANSPGADARIGRPPGSAQPREPRTLDITDGAAHRRLLAVLAA
ncbi:condensation domain-containing protein, partial [Frankia tisae]|uniref:condensation domain-containing protein n=1 Tax=Frankia tisae TaxID=2950104 RepID=UPI0021C10C93